MELIRQNPYHVIGILAGANQRTISRQKAKIKAWVTTGKDLIFDTDLEAIDIPDRSDGAIERAFSNIELNQNKLFNALFWFVNHNHIDETALNYLQSGDIEKAEDIWENITNGKELSSKYFTAYNNLGTLKLAAAFAYGSVDVKKLKAGVWLKTELLTSENFNDFCHLVADETYTADQDKTLDTFISTLLEETNKIQGTEVKNVAAQISTVHPKIKSLVSEKLTDTPLHNIERKAEQTKKKRTDSPEDGLDLARKLYRDTKSDLTTLSEILGTSDLKYKMVADKLAKEILQCGIDYFTEYKDDEELHDGDLGNDIMQLFIKAQSIAVGTHTKERIAENIDGLQEWIDDADEREKQELIGEDLAFVASKLERFQKLADTIENADDLVTSCKPRLQNMESALGATDDFYLKISSAVVNNAQGMLVTVINAAQQDQSVRMDLLGGLMNIIRAALKVSVKLGTLDMMPELKEQYNKNHQTLISIFSQISSAGSGLSSSSDGGCYIATMAYGSYDHPQVLELRKFRDETLSKTMLGRQFIQVYYWFSPKLVQLLRGKALYNSIAVQNVLQKR